MPNSIHKPTAQGVHLTIDFKVDPAFTSSSNNTDLLKFASFYYLQEQIFFMKSTPTGGKNRNFWVFQSRYACIIKLPTTLEQWQTLLLRTDEKAF